MIIRSKVTIKIATVYDSGNNGLSQVQLAIPLDAGKFYSGINVIDCIDTKGLPLVTEADLAMPVIL
jgi:hypothetical protein